MKTFAFYLFNLFMPAALTASTLIPRETLFKPPACASVKVSPNGKMLAFIQTSPSGTMNLRFSPNLSITNSIQLSNFSEPDIKAFHWLSNNQEILLLKDSEGTRMLSLYLADINSQTLINLTESFKNANVKIFKVHPKLPKAIIGIKQRNPKFYDLYLLDRSNNSLTLLEKNDLFINFVFDALLNCAAKILMNEDGSLTVSNSHNEKLFNISSSEAFNTEFLSANHKENCLYFLDNRTTNTTQLKKIKLNDLSHQLSLGHDEKNDIQDVIFDQQEPCLFSTYHHFKKWHPLTKAAESDVNYLVAKIGSNFDIISQSQNNQIWTLKSSSPNLGIAFWLYNRPQKKLVRLFSYPSISSLSKMYPLKIISRDGLELVCYLTLPHEWDNKGLPKKPLPLVIIPHGGPFKIRDFYEYSSYHQWLANRGYAVLSVNFRLSAGFGKEFVNAGNGQWGKKAHEDILDAVQWCIDKKIADKDRLAVFGGSYGGYEALASLTFTPNIFACAIAICGPSHLKTVLDKVPFYWEFPRSPLSDKMVYYTKNNFIVSMGGNPDNPEEVPYLEQCSPLNYVDQITKPLLLVHGRNDPIVAASESDQIFSKMQEKDLPVIYISFPDEGHGIARSVNQFAYLAYSEWLLSKYLGGRFEPVSAEKVNASSANIQLSQIDPQLESR